MADVQRPTLLTVITIVILVFSVLGVIGGIGSFFGADAIAAVIGAKWMTLIKVQALVGLVVAILAIFASIQILRNQKNGIKLLKLWAMINIGLAVLWVVVNLVLGLPVSWVGTVIGIAIAGGVIAVCTVMDDVKKYEASL